MKSPEVIAWEKWMASEEGRSCLRGTASGEYLENRLYRAFFAGVDAVLRKEAGNGE